MCNATEQIRRQAAFGSFLWSVSQMFVSELLLKSEGLRANIFLCTAFSQQPVMTSVLAGEAHIHHTFQLFEDDGNGFNLSAFS